VFGLSLADHLRLTFGHVIYSHKVHATRAARHARLDRALKTAEALFLLSTAAAAAAIVVTPEPALAIATATTAALATTVLIIRLAFDFERSAHAHRDCSTRLWYLREQYRALLADLKDGALTVEGARDRRDALMATLQRIYEHAPPADREQYQSARQSLKSLDEETLSDEEIDRFLPPSLQKTSAPATAAQPAPAEARGGG
jgi:hypothetical protein